MLVTMAMKYKHYDRHFNDVLQLLSNIYRNIFLLMIFLEEDAIIYPTKKEMHTVTFPNFLENNKKFSYSIYTNLKCC